MRVINLFSTLESNERIVIRQIPGRGLCMFVRRWVPARGELESIAVFSDDEIRSGRVTSDAASERIQAAMRRVRTLAAEGAED